MGGDTIKFSNSGELALVHTHAEMKILITWLWAENSGFVWTSYIDGI